jgi:rhamnose utilization protein RhaD (predicted bifunctional aldolase and dehydrogenase)
MSEREQALSEVVKMSRRLAEEHKQFVILGEGNTSARIDGSRFVVKASGAQLPTITAEGFVECDADCVLSLLQADDVSDDNVKKVLAEACVVPGETRRPSVETVLHALLLKYEGINFVAHTHPIAVNIITCSQNGKSAVQGRMFPDEIVCCGIAPVWVDWVDPGVPLARKVKAGVDRFIDEYGMLPKCILLQNHGLIAFGRTAAEVESATLMWDKTAQILLGTYALGGPRYFSPELTDKIANRPDEKYREKIIFG